MLHSPAGRPSSVLAFIAVRPVYGPADDWQIWFNLHLPCECLLSMLLLSAWGSLMLRGRDECFIFFPFTYIFPIKPVALWSGGHAFMLFATGYETHSGLRMNELWLLIGIRHNISTHQCCQEIENTVPMSDISSDRWLWGWECEAASVSAVYWGYSVVAIT